MVNRQRAVGTDAETKVKNWLRANGYRYAKRLTLSGAADVGDVHMGDGIPVCIEVKGGQKAVSGIPSHVREMLAEGVNAEADTGVVIAKKARCDNVDEWFAVLPAAEWLALIKQIYPPPPSYDVDHGSDHVGDNRLRPGRRIRIGQRVGPDVGHRGR